MLTNIVDFFRNLPAKRCVHCRKQIEEQHECYGNICPNCMGYKDWGK